MKPKQPEQIRTISDDEGNLLTVRNNLKRVLISLKLVSENKRRRIGTINLKRRVLEVKRNREKHIFYTANAYGFNYKLLAEAKLFDNVRLRDEHDEWLIPRKMILEQGQFLHFKKAGGFELQIFMPIDKLDQYKKQPKI